MSEDDPITQRYERAAELLRSPEIAEETGNELLKMTTVVLGILDCCKKGEDSPSDEVIKLLDANPELGTEENLRDSLTMLCIWINSDQNTREQISINISKAIEFAENLIRGKREDREAAMNLVKKLSEEGV